MSGGRSRLGVFSGLPATGKTTLARWLAGERGWVALRVDTVETTLRARGPLRGPEGYEVCFALARDFLGQGHSVITDMVNADAWEREYWAEIARDVGAEFLPVLINCSDRVEHRHRVETRRADIPGHQLPDWDAVQARAVTRWNVPHHVLDTAGKSIPLAGTELLQLLGVEGSG